MSFKSFHSDTRGLITTEFAVISFALFMIIFFVVELTLLYFFIQSAEKSAQMGARLAIVSDIAAAGVPSSNGLATGGIFGTSCSITPSPCTGFATASCIGGTSGCNVDSFNRILARMQNFMPGLEAENVAITYSYEDLGYAGGPIIPAVTVAISGVPHQTGILGVVLGGGGDPITIPAVSVTLTGEDMSDSGA